MAENDEKRNFSSRNLSSYSSFPFRYPYSLLFSLNGHERLHVYNYHQTLMKKGKESLIQCRAIDEIATVALRPCVFVKWAASAARPNIFAPSVDCGKKCICRNDTNIRLDRFREEIGPKTGLKLVVLWADAFGGAKMSKGVKIPEWSCKKKKSLPLFPLPQHLCASILPSSSFSFFTFPASSPSNLITWFGKNCHHMKGGEAARYIRKVDCRPSRASVTPRQLTQTVQNSNNEIYSRHKRFNVTKRLFFYCHHYIYLNLLIFFSVRQRKAVSPFGFWTYLSMELLVELISSYMEWKEKWDWSRVKAYFSY